MLPPAGDGIGSTSSPASKHLMFPDAAVEVAPPPAAVAAPPPPPVVVRVNSSTLAPFPPRGTDSVILSCIK
jgi:hypothetical protein